MPPFFMGPSAHGFRTQATGSRCSVKPRLPAGGNVCKAWYAYLLLGFAGITWPPVSPGVSLRPGPLTN